MKGKTELNYSFVPRSRTNDKYDYIDVEIGKVRAGKVRCLFRYQTVIIYNITIFEEFRGKGYGRRTIDMLKSRYKLLIADKVRFNAQSFWTKMGFQPSATPENWEFSRKDVVE